MCCSRWEETPPHTHTEGSLTPVFSSSETKLGALLKGHTHAQSPCVLRVMGCVGAALTWWVCLPVRFGDTCSLLPGPCNGISHTESLACGWSRTEVQGLAAKMVLVVGPVKSGVAPEAGVEPQRFWELETEILHL